MAVISERQTQSSHEYLISFCGYRQGNAPFQNAIFSFQGKLRATYSENSRFSTPSEGHYESIVKDGLKLFGGNLLWAGVPRKYIVVFQEVLTQDRFATKSVTNGYVGNGFEDWRLANSPGTAYIFLTYLRGTKVWRFNIDTFEETPNPPASVTPPSTATQEVMLEEALLTETIHDTMVKYDYYILRRSDFLTLKYFNYGTDLSISISQRSTT
jgi:hypothetical protein